MQILLAVVLAHVFSTYRVILNCAGFLWRPALFFVLFVFVSGSLNASAIMLQQKAQDLNIAQSKQWKKLLYYVESWFGPDRGMFDSEKMYLHPNGKFDPSGELNSSLESFFIPPSEYEDKNLHPQCAFPARFSFLNSKLDFSKYNVPVVRCEKLNAWIRDNPAKRISVVFSSYYPDNPASMFGHTFLRLHYDNKENNTSGMRDSSINFAAFPDSMNPFTYPLKGSMGFFPGRYQMMPFFVKVQEYNNAERRDLWAYELDYSVEDIQFLLMALWEIGNNHVDYYYFDDNCSAVLLTLLEAVRPHFDWKSTFDSWVVPADTLRVVAQTPGLVRNIEYEPSILTRFHSRYKNLLRAERDAFEGIVKQNNFKSLVGKNDEFQVHVLDATADYIDFVDNVAGTSMGKENAELRTKVLIKRSKLKTSSSNNIKRPTREQPDLGHPTSYVSLGLRRNKSNEHSLGLLWRPALHEMLAASKGYPRGLEIGFFNLNLDWNAEKKRLLVNDFSLIKVWSLPMTPTFLRKPVWSLDIGHKFFENCSDSVELECKLTRVQGGVGLNVLLIDSKVVPFAMAIGEVGVSSYHEENTYIGLGVRYGSWFELTRSHRALLQIDASKRFSRTSQLDHRGDFVWSYSHSDSNEIRLKAFWNISQSGFELSYLRYY